MKKPNKKKTAKLSTLIGEAQRMAAAARYDQAEAICKQILQADAVNKEATVLKAQIAFNLNRPSEAGVLLQKAIQQDPTDAQLYSHMALVLERIGQSDNAIQAYRYAVSLKPDFLDARLAVGNLLYALGRYPEAEAEYQLALEIRDTHAPAYYNLALAQAATGNVTEALVNYEHAITLKRDYHAAYFNLANLKRSLGDARGAVEAYRQAATLAPEQKLYWQQFALSARMLDADEIDENLEGDILRCLQIDGIDHSGLVKVVAALVERNCLPASQLDADARRQELASMVRDNSLTLLYRFEPLRLIMGRTVINSDALERLLTDIRFAFARVWVPQVAELELDSDTLAFLVALAHQCFLNEYVYLETSEEKELIASLRADFERQLLADNSVSDAAIALLGCYFPLGSILNKDPTALQCRHDGQGAISRLIQLQVNEPVQERNLVADIATYGELESAKEDAVRRQYEENPYPRWVTLPFTLPRPSGDVFGQLFPYLLATDTRFVFAPSILVAGCGTGKHALMTARRFAGGKVTAVDFSRTSLAFAVRQAKAMNVNNIQFGQADIMHLPDSFGEFDIVEAVGVLHHLADPLEGWRRLCYCLRPGGFMKIGLYSDLGRQPVRAAQKLAAQWGLGPTADDIRAFRRRIMALDQGAEERQIIRFSDFYSLSGCRDLAFHEREQWFTLPQIETMLRELDLRFVGFELEEQFYLRDYKAQFPYDPDATSLEYWHQYELQHPEVFASMYQFWVQRPQ